jgi:hypothetical protein
MTSTNSTLLKIFALPLALCACAATAQMYPAKQIRKEIEQWRQVVARARIRIN